MLIFRMMGSPGIREIPVASTEQFVAELVENFRNIFSSDLVPATSAFPADLTPRKINAGLTVINGRRSD